jgi:hypothetical protein
MGDSLMPNNANKYYCEICHFTCNKMSNWKTHITTRKHATGNNMVTDGYKIMPKNTTTYDCSICGKKYKHRQGLSRHKKTCTINSEKIKNTNNVDEEVISISSIDKADITQKLIDLIVTKNQDFMKELVTNISVSNKDVMEKMIEMIPHIKGNAEHSYNNTNSHNTNNFNIQMFLNEKCKNAMNITDFIESLPVTAETFDNTIENGLTKSITTMITNGLNNMDVLDRPIHCTDVNRKTLYVKDNDTWEKDNEMKCLLDGIKDLSIKQRVNISKWHDANEGWETNANLQTRLSTLVFHTMEDIENNDKEIGKIIRAVSKNTYLSNEVKEQYK